MQPSKIKKLFVKVTSLEVLPFLLLQQILPSNAWAVSSASASPAAIEIPKEIGNIEGIHLTDKNAPVIVHIQNAHGNYEAQKNVQALLTRFTDQYQFKTLFLEGANDKLHPEFFRFFKDNAELNLKIADSLARKAELTGPELFLVEKDQTSHSGSPIKAFGDDINAYGIETAEVYRANRKAFQEVLRATEKTEAFLQDMDMQIERLTAPYLNAALKNYLRRLEAHEIHNHDIMAWVRFLKDQAAKHLDINLEDAFYQKEWPMLVRFVRLEKIEKNMARSELEKEKAAFLAALKDSKLDSALIQKAETLLTVSLSQNTSQKPSYLEMVDTLGSVASALPKDFSFAPYQNLKYFMQLLIIEQELRGETVMDEIERLESQLGKKMARTETEKKLWVLFKDYRLLKKLFSLELTKRDYEKMSADRSRIMPSRMAESFSKINEKKRVRDIRFSHLDEINRLFDLALAFYQGAVERDRIMAENLLKQMTALKENKAIVVTGGFHSEGMKQYFESKGFSYYLITPRITEAGDLRAYHAAMLESNAVVKNSQIENIAKLLTRENIVAEGGIESLAHIQTVIQQAVTTAVSPENLLSLDAAALEKNYGVIMEASRAEVRSVSSVMRSIILYTTLAGIYYLGFETEKIPAQTPAKKIDLNAERKANTAFETLKKRHPQIEFKNYKKLIDDYPDLSLLLAEQLGKSMAEVEKINKNLLTHSEFPEKRAQLEFFLTPGDGHTPAHVGFAFQKHANPESTAFWGNYFVGLKIDPDYHRQHMFTTFFDFQHLSKEQQELWYEIAGRDLLINREITKKQGDSVFNLAFPKPLKPGEKETIRKQVENRLATLYSFYIEDHTGIRPLPDFEIENAKFREIAEGEREDPRLKAFVTALLKKGEVTPQDIPIQIPWHWIGLAAAGLGIGTAGFYGWRKWRASLRTVVSVPKSEMRSVEVLKSREAMYADMRQKYNEILALLEKMPERFSLRREILREFVDKFESSPLEEIIKTALKYSDASFYETFSILSEDYRKQLRDAFESLVFSLDELRETKTEPSPWAPRIGWGILGVMVFLLVSHALYDLASKGIQALAKTETSQPAARLQPAAPPPTVKEKPAAQVPPKSDLEKRREEIKNQLIHWEGKQNKLNEELKRLHHHDTEESEKLSEMIKHLTPQETRWKKEIDEIEEFIKKSFNGGRNLIVTLKKEGIVGEYQVLAEDRIKHLQEEIDISIDIRTQPQRNKIEKIRIRLRERKEALEDVIEVLDRLNKEEKKLWAFPKSEMRSISSFMHRIILYTTLAGIFYAAQDDAKVSAQNAINNIRIMEPDEKATDKEKISWLERELKIWGSITPSVLNNIRVQPNPDFIRETFEPHLALYKQLDTPEALDAFPNHKGNILAGARVMPALYELLEQTQKRKTTKAQEVEKKLNEIHDAFSKIEKENPKTAPWNEMKVIYRALRIRALQQVFENQQTAQLQAISQKITAKEISAKQAIDQFREFKIKQNSPNEIHELIGDEILQITIPNWQVMKFNIKPPPSEGRMLLSKQWGTPFWSSDKIATVLKEAVSREYLDRILNLTPEAREIVSDILLNQPYSGTKQIEIVRGRESVKADIPILHFDRVFREYFIPRLEYLANEIKSGKAAPNFVREELITILEQSSQLRIIMQKDFYPAIRPETNQRMNELIREIQKMRNSTPPRSEMRSISSFMHRIILYTTLAGIFYPGFGKLPAQTKDVIKAGSSLSPSLWDVERRTGQLAYKMKLELSMPSAAKRMDPLNSRDELKRLISDYASLKESGVWDGPIPDALKLLISVETRKTAGSQAVQDLEKIQEVFYEIVEKQTRERKNQRPSSPSSTAIFHALKIQTLQKVFENQQRDQLAVLEEKITAGKISQKQAAEELRQFKINQQAPNMIHDLIGDEIRGLEGLKSPGSSSPLKHIPSAAAVILSKQWGTPFLSGEETDFLIQDMLTDEQANYLENLKTSLTISPKLALWDIEKRSAQLAIKMKTELSMPEVSKAMGPQNARDEIKLLMSAYAAVKESGILKGDVKQQSTLAAWTQSIPAAVKLLDDVSRRKAAGPKTIEKLGKIQSNSPVSSALKIRVLQKVFENQQREQLAAIEEKIQTNKISQKGAAAELQKFKTLQQAPHMIHELIADEIWAIEGLQRPEISSAFKRIPSAATVILSKQWGTPFLNPDKIKPSKPAPPRSETRDQTAITSGKVHALAMIIMDRLVAIAAYQMAVGIVTMGAAAFNRIFKDRSEAVSGTVYLPDQKKTDAANQRYFPGISAGKAGYLLGTDTGIGTDNALALIRHIIKDGPIAILVHTEAERSIVAEFNKTLSAGQKIIAVESVEEASAELGKRLAALGRDPKSIEAIVNQVDAARLKKELLAEGFSIKDIKSGAFVAYMQMAGLEFAAKLLIEIKAQIKLAQAA